MPVIGEFIEVSPSKCAQQAPQAIRALDVDAGLSFKTPTTLKLVRERVSLGGVRLAAILEDLFG